MKKWYRVFDTYVRPESYQTRRSAVFSMIMPFLDKQTATEAAPASSQENGDAATPVVADAPAIAAETNISEIDLKGLVYEILLRALDCVGRGAASDSQHLLSHDLLYTYMLYKKYLVANTTSINFILDSFIRESQRRLRTSHNGSLDLSVLQTLSLYLCFTLHATLYYSASHQLDASTQNLVENAIAQLLSLLTVQCTLFFGADILRFVEESKAARIFARTVLADIFSEKISSISVESFLYRVIFAGILQNSDMHGLAAGIGLQLLLLQQKDAKDFAGSAKDALLRCFNEFLMKHSNDVPAVLKEGSLKMGETSEATFAGFGLLVREFIAADKAQMETTLSQTLFTAFRRSRSAIAPVATAIISLLEKSEKASDVITVLLPALAESLSSKNERERNIAISMAKLIAQKLANGSSVLRTVVLKLQDLVQHGGLGIPEKQSTMSALRVLAAYDDQSSAEYKTAVDAIATSVIIPFVESILDSKTENDKVKSEACEAGTAWIVRSEGKSCLASIPDSLLKIFDKVVQQTVPTSSVDERSSEYDLTRKTVLKNMAELAGQTYAAQFSGDKNRVEQLVSFVAQSEQKLVTRPSAVYALRVLLVLALKDAKLKTELFQSKKLMSKVGHLLMIDGTVSRFVRPDDHEALANLLYHLYICYFNELYERKLKEEKNLLAQQKKGAAAAQGALAKRLTSNDKTSALFLLEHMNVDVAYLLVNPSFKVRQTMSAGVQKIVSSEWVDSFNVYNELFLGGLCYGLLPKLVDKLHKDLEAAKNQPKKEDVEDPEKLVRAAFESHKKLVAFAFSTLAPRIPAGDSTRFEYFITYIMPMVLLFGHHPFVYQHAEASAFSKYFHGHHFEAEQLAKLHAHFGTIVDTLIGVLDSGVSAASSGDEDQPEQKVDPVEEQLSRMQREAVGSAFASLVEMFISTAVYAKDKVKGENIAEESAYAESEQNRDAKFVAAKVFSIFHQRLAVLVERLLNVSKIDMDVFIHHTKYAGKEYQTPFHDVDAELTNNPLFRQTKEDETDVTGTKFRYRLTNAEWQTVLKKEKDVKAKQPKVDINTIRKQLVEKALLKKEKVYFNAIQSSSQSAWWLLNTAGEMFDHAFDRRRGRLAKTLQHILVHFVSQLVFHASDLFSTQVDVLRTKAFQAFRSMCKSTRGHIDQTLVDSIARCTYRIKARRLDINRRELDDDVIFAEHVINHLRREFMRKIIEADLFSVFVPFFECVINRYILVIQKEKLSFSYMGNASLTQCMSVLSAHAGLENLRSGTVRPRVARVLVEALSHFGTLYRQAYNALLSFAQNLHFEDVLPLLEALKIPQGGVRQACLKALAEYPLFQNKNELLQDNEAARFSAAENAQFSSKFTLLLWFAQFDEEEQNATAAKNLWAIFEQKVLRVNQQQFGKWRESVLEELLTYLDDTDEYVRITAGSAIAALTGDAKKQDPSAVSKILSRLYDKYDRVKALAKELGASFNAKHAILGVAQSLNKCAEHISDKQDLESVFKFIIYKSLWDKDTEIQEEMVKSGLALIDKQGQSNLDHLLKQMQSVLDSKNQLNGPEGNLRAKSTGFMTARQQEELAAALEEEYVYKDYVLASVAVFMGTLAKFFDATNPRLVQVVNQLVDTLHIQSNSVQRSVSNVLSPLVEKLFLEPATRPRVGELIDRLLKDLVEPNASYGDRRGTAYGIAGFIVGLKIKAFKDYNLMNRLHHLGQGKATPAAKEGVFQAYEVLAERLKSKVEPYLSTHILPQLIEGISDEQNEGVRESAEGCSNVTMQEALSGHGVRLILPYILKSVRIDSTSSATAWRTKVASIRILGSMAYCAPRQLSESLPQIIPVLADSLHDTHPKVAKSSFHALERVGGVCQNPEIAQQVPTLLDTLRSLDDRHKLHLMLEGLLYTRFLHSIDPASLSLLVPVLLRGLRERNTLIKQNSAQIIGSMTALCSDSRDIVPYIADIIMPLKDILIDPQPNVRSSAAKAIGSLAKSIGENRMHDLVRWLYANLEKADTATSIHDVERSGAAQGLCEMIAAQGVNRLREMLPVLIQKISPAEKAHVRQGYMEVFIYLPALMRSAFEPFLPDCLPRILEGLSDNSDILREAAVKSCKVIVELYASNATSIALLLPALLDGMDSADSRQRFSSLQVLSDFLRRLSEQHALEKKGPASTGSAHKAKKKLARMAAGEEESGDAGEDELGEEGIDMEDMETQEKAMEAFMEEEVQMIDIDSLQQIVQSREVVDRLLCLLFMLQYDEHTNIRNAASRLWRDLVRRPGFILKAIAKPLLQTIITHLSSENEDQQYLAGKALGELVNKMGEKIMNDVIPSLDAELTNPESPVQNRQGVALGLREVLANGSEKLIKAQQKKLLGFIKKAICDQDDLVREYAAEAFDILFKAVGTSVINEIVQELLTDLNEQSLSGLQQLIIVRGYQFLPKLIPTILGSNDEEPISEDNLRILAAVVKVSDELLEPYMEKLLQKLIVQSGIQEKPSENMYAAFKNTLQNVQPEELDDLIERLVKAMQSSKVSVRRGACYGVEVFCREYFNRMQTNKDGSQSVLKFLSEDDEDELMDRHVPVLLEALIRLFLDREAAVINQSWNAVRAMLTPSATGILKTKDDQPRLIPTIRETIKDLTENEGGHRIVDQLPAFNIIPKGPEPLLDTLLQGLMFGKTAEVREESALGLGDLIALSSEIALKPFVVKLTGPLIRIVGDRFPWQVKAAILKTLSLLLTKGGDGLRPFLPQLQTIFVKTLQDANSQVRLLAADGLGKLVQLLGARIGTLLGELHNGLKAVAQKQKLLQVLTDAQQLGSTQALVYACNKVLESLLRDVNNLKLAKSQNVQALHVTLAEMVHAVSEPPFGFDAEAVDLRNKIAHCLATASLALMQSEEDESFFTSNVMEQEFDVSQSMAAKDQFFNNPARLCARILLLAHLLRMTKGKFIEHKLVQANWSTLKQRYIVSVLEQKHAAERVNMAAITAGKYVLVGETTAAQDIDIVKVFATVSTKALPTEHQLKLHLANSMKFVCRRSQSTIHLLGWTEVLLNLTRDRYNPVKLAAELALVNLLQLEFGTTVSEHYLRENVQSEKEQGNLRDLFTKMKARAEKQEDRDEDEDDVQ